MEDNALAQDLRRALPAGWDLRERVEDDLPFLGALYAQTREEELRPVAWTPEQKRDFLADQFAKQHAHYLQYYAGAHWWVLLCDGQPAGRLYVQVTARELRLMDIALLAVHRGAGVGTAIMGVLSAHADTLGVEASLHVEPFNPAHRLYQRHGFATVETHGAYLFMRRPPAQVVS